ncbi:MAG TPA: sensor histidine kinase, partial [Clostridiales bacterium]|nr:sensor histidine kinase [Clostridiales bacterium]
TPLTSIINYVDLLGQEQLEGKAAEYLEVLDRQSKRLKKLTEDLVEASKASTGNLNVSLEPTGICEILHQALGEYTERLEAGRLEAVLDTPGEEVYVMADGRLLWRVVDNLLSNVSKYSLAGTRVYLQVEQLNGEVVMSVKNISRDRLGIDAQELMERFVRGDTARSTEGSGLGLNIARSLTELMQGRFHLIVDGDLFKVEVRFWEIG